MLNSPALVGATDEVQVANIIAKKAEQYEYNAAMLQDYIGKAFNNSQKKINDLIVDKIDIEEQIKAEKQKMENSKVLIAKALQSLGIDKLDDKTSDICSSISIVDAQEERVEPKERSLTSAEMKELLLANGLPVKIWDEEKIPAKPSMAKISFRRGKKVAQIKKNEALDVLESLSGVVELESA